MARRKGARPQAPPRSTRPEWVAPAALLAGLATIVYANSVGNGFISDDKIQLLRNPLVTSVSQIPSIFGSGVWSTWDPGHPGNYYRPLQFLVYLALYEVAGFSASAFHLFMVLLHAANTVIVYGLIRRLGPSRLALGGAALFAVHPIHTEVVDWIASAPDLMVTTLVLAGVWRLAGEKGAPEAGAIAGHCGLYLAALLTKETGAMLLPLYAGYEFIFSGRGWTGLRANTKLYAAMAATAAVYLVMRMAALGSLAPGQAAFFRLSPMEFVLSGVVLAADYVGALLLPVNLNYFHIFHPVGSLTPAVLVSMLVLAAGAVIFFRVRAPLVAFGLFWIAVTLAPALNLTGVGQNVFAERYLYLPSAGFCWIAAWAWNQFAASKGAWATAGGAALLLLGAGIAIARNRDWRDDYTLFQVTLRQSPSSGWLHNWMASAHVERNEFAQALAEERLAVRYEPGVAAFHENLGNILLVTDPRAAAAEFQKLLALQPDRAQNHADLGLALEASGKLADAAGEFQTALRLEPDNAEAREALPRIQARLHNQLLR